MAYKVIDRSFWDTKYPEAFVQSLWTGCYYRDFELLSSDYYHVGLCILFDVLNNRQLNFKCDFVFPVSAYMFRHGIELAVKAVICAKSNNKQISECFQKEKHDLESLFKRCKAVLGKVLRPTDFEWLSDFMLSASQWDPKADFFRYPSSTEVRKEIGDSSIDIVETSKTLAAAYGLISSAFESAVNVPVCKANSGYFTVASSGFGNCVPQRDETSMKYYLVVEGFSDAAKLLYREEGLSWREKCFPLLFLLRHAIELELKNLTCDRNIIGAKSGLGHNFEKLWKIPESTLKQRAIVSDWELSPLETVNCQLRELSKLDRSGFLFRYPVDKSLEYKIPSNSNLDIKSIYEYQMGIISFLDGCNSVLGEMADYEQEMMRDCEW